MTANNSILRQTLRDWRASLSAEEHACLVEKANAIMAAYLPKEK
jgi:hypothetical protein